MGSVLTDSQVERYDRDGFLVVEGFVDATRCAELRDAALQIVAEFQPNDRRSVFTTNEQERTSDSDFLASGGGVWCFFEEEAFGPDGRLRQAKELSINKIGHAQHDLDPTFESFSYTADLAGVAADIGLVDALALQSMYIFKQPHIGGEVGCHQDATFLYTNPLTVTGFWFAIEDATLENGCLWAAPGGHRTSVRKLFKRKLFKRTGDADYADSADSADSASFAGDTGDADNADYAGDDVGTTFDVLDPAPLPAPATLVPLEVPAGSMVVLHGKLPHWSDVNRSATSRHAYSLHCISAAAHYPSWNWLQRPTDMPLRPLHTAARLGLQDLRTADDNSQKASA